MSNASSHPAFAGHVIQERQTRSFTLYAPRVAKSYSLGRQVDGAFSAFRPVEGAKFSYDSNYAFSVTWTPGSLFLAGDLGELAVTHWNALADFEGALAWMLGADFDYFMGKTGERQVYDADATARDIVRRCNEEPLNALLGSVQWDKDHRCWRRVAHGGWRGELREMRADPDNEDDFFLSDENPWRMSPRPSQRGWDHHTPIDSMWNMHECWIPWLRLAMDIDYVRDRRDFDPTIVLRAAERRRLRAELFRHVENAGEAASLLQRLGYDDWYGCYEWTPRHRIQYAALRRWAELAARREAVSVEAA